MGERPLHQPSSVPRFNEDSAFKKHWPLLWLTLLCGFFVTSFAIDFNNLGKLFDNQGSDVATFETRFSFPNSMRKNYFSERVELGDKADRVSGQTAQQTLTNRSARWSADAARFARAGLIRSNDFRPNSDESRNKDIKNYMMWLFHRRLALELCSRYDYSAGESEFIAALNCANALGPRYPSRAISLADLAIFNEMRAAQMQQVAQLLLRGVLPIFSFLAALLPFALFMAFIRSRDKVDTAGGDSGNLAGRLFLKSMLLVSWFGVVVTGWLALRNYGMGLASGLADPSALAFFGTLGALFVSCCLLLRYMPPVKSLSLKRSLVGVGFGGVLIVAKAIAIYLGLCLSLAGHPALKDGLFCEALYSGKQELAGQLAEEAKLTAVATLDRLQMEPRRDQICQEMDQVLKRPAPETVDYWRVEGLRNLLGSRIADEVFVPNNSFLPNVFRTTMVRDSSVSSATTPVNMRNLTVGMILKACLAYLLLFYPEFLAYILLGLKQSNLALSTFKRAVKVKEYFLGSAHWLVVGTLEMFGSCLLSFKRSEPLRQAGEDYLRQAISLYEHSRGRHDELTIAAKLSLAHFYSERGDNHQAEKILVEALRDVGKDMDTLAYCNLLSVIGKLYSQRGSYSKAKQTYKQVIELLEGKLSKMPSSRGVIGYVRNIYAATPSWQLELKLVHAYLDLAEVFSRAKYNGEAQRLTEDANKRIGAFTSELVVVMELAAAFVRARLAMAALLCEHGRSAECFALLADANKQLARWGYGRSALAFEIAVNESELGILASRGLSNYLDQARANFQEANMRFGPNYASFSLQPDSDLQERWAKLKERFGHKKTGISGDCGPATGFSTDIGLFSPPNTTSAAPLPQIAASSPETDVPSRSWFIWTAATPAYSAGSSNISACNSSVTAPSISSTPSPEATIPEGTFTLKTGRAADKCKDSKLIKDSRENADEGIIVRWRRESKHEALSELGLRLEHP